MSIGPGKLTFSLPLYSIVPVITGILMLWGGLTIFNALRFLDCSSWALLPAPPQKVIHLQGVLHDEFYVKTESDKTYCFQLGQWKSCRLPPYELHSEQAPTWIMGRLSSDFHNASASQVMRVGNFSKVVYYLLLDDGQLLTCETSLRLELENMLRSGLFFWLVVPLVVLIGSIIAFGNIFIKHAHPTLWDWWGRGKKI